MPQVTSNKTPRISLLRWVELMNKGNGYAGIYNYRSAEEKRIVEAGVAMDWHQSAVSELGLKVDEPTANPKDPPDFFNEIAGRRHSMELVQLVDKGHKERAIRGESHHSGQLFLETQWCASRLERKLNETIEAKSLKYQRRDVEVDLLVLHTDEPWLSSDMVNRWLPDMEILEYPNIRASHLLMSYEPGKGYPLFELYGQFGKPT